MSPLAPALVALVLFLLLGWRWDALYVALATLGGAALARAAARHELRRQLETLTHQVRAQTAAGALTGAPGDEPSESLEDVAPLQAAIAALHQGLSTRNADLQKEANTLTAVLDGMAEGLWVTDAEGTVVRHNDALRGMLRAS